jgi:hypothetical protein
MVAEEGSKKLISELKEQDPEVREVFVIKEVHSEAEKTEAPPAVQPPTIEPGPIPPGGVPAVEPPAAVAGGTAPSHQPTGATSAPLTTDSAPGGDAPHDVPVAGSSYVGPAQDVEPGTPIAAGPGPDVIGGAAAIPPAGPAFTEGHVPAVGHHEGPAAIPPVHAPISLSPEAGLAGGMVAAAFLGALAPVAPDLDELPTDPRDLLGRSDRRTPEVTPAQLALWIGPIDNYLGIPRDEFLSLLPTRCKDVLGRVPTPEETRAWADTYDLVAPQVTLLPKTPDWLLAFYPIVPLQTGRGPNVFVMAGHVGFAIDTPPSPLTRGPVDGLAAVTRALQAITSPFPVHPILVAGLPATPPKKANGVWTVGPEGLAPLMVQLGGAALHQPLDWLPLLVREPARAVPLIEAARRIGEGVDPAGTRYQWLPNPDALLNTLAALATTGIPNGEHHLVFASGAPGTGKTVAGLRFAHLADFAPARGGKPGEASGVFLTGNDSAIKALPVITRKPEFVRPIGSFLDEYAHKAIPENVWVVDDASQASDPAGSDSPARLLDLASKRKEGTVLVLLLPAGSDALPDQLAAWNNAIGDAGKHWLIHAPLEVARHLPAATNIVPDERLSLKDPIRWPAGPDVAHWAKALLDGNVADAAPFAENARKQGYALYVVRDPEQAREYSKQRYRNALAKRFGVLSTGDPARSAAQDATRGPDPRTAWYINPDLPLPAAVNFDIPVYAGLDLDLPVVEWREDLVWKGTAWSSTRAEARDAYRHMLTRGRDGLVLYVPPNATLDATHQALREAGAIPLTP